MVEAASFKFLPLTLSMETLGGLSTPLVRRGTPLPTRRTQRFSTAVDNQKAVTIQVYLGESPIAANNILVAKCELGGLPEAPKGELEIEVIFEVNEQCRVKIIASEKKSGNQVCSEIDNPSPHLTEEKVNEMLAKANAAQQEDKESADRIEVRNKAMNIVHRAEKYLQDQQNHGLRSSTDEQIDEALASLGVSLKTNNLVAIRDKTNRIEQLLPKTTFGTFGEFGDLFQGFGSFFGTPAARQNRPGTRAPGSGPDERIGATPSTEQKTSESAELAKSDKGVFSAGQYFDAKRLVRDLFACAEREIVVIDAYAGEDVLSLLTVKRQGVAVKILTGKASAAFLTLSRDFNRQYIRTRGTFLRGISRQIHNHRSKGGLSLRCLPGALGEQNLHVLQDRRAHHG